MLDSDSAEHPEAVGEQGPLPDLLPHNEHPPPAANQDGASRERAVRQLEARRLADQLRAVGDEYNAMVLRRAVRVTFHLQPKIRLFVSPCVTLRNGSVASVASVDLLLSHKLLTIQTGC